MTLERFLFAKRSNGSYAKEISIFCVAGPKLARHRTLCTASRSLSRALNLPYFFNVSKEDYLFAFERCILPEFLISAFRHLLLQYFIVSLSSRVSKPLRVFKSILQKRHFLLKGVVGVVICMYPNMFI